MFAFISWVALSDDEPINWKQKHDNINYKTMEGIKMYIELLVPNGN